MDPARLGRGADFCFTEIGARKESPQSWQAVMTALGVDAHELAMVGDSLEADVIAPRRVGIYSVWFKQHNRQRPRPADGSPACRCRAAARRGNLMRSQPLKLAPRACACPTD